jgi:hypothetical protein
MCEWLLFNANSASFQIHHGENKNRWDDNDDDVRFILDQYTELDIYNATSLK